MACSCAIELQISSNGNWKRRGNVALDSSRIAHLYKHLRVQITLCEPSLSGTWKI